MILVTGATGFIGKNFVLTFTEQEKLRILARKTSNIVLFNGKMNVEIVFGNLEADEGLDQAMDGCDTVVHCAARTFGRNYREFYDTNTLGTYNLLRAMERKQVKRLLFISSHAACGTDASQNPIDETHPANPGSIYGITKKLAEDAVMRSNLRFTVLRPCAVYGPYDVEILKYIRMLNIGVCPVIGPGEKYVSLVYVGDLVNLMLTIIRKNHYDGETYLVSDGQNYSYSAVFAEICKALGRNKYVRICVPLPVAKLFGLLNEVLLPERKRMVDRNKIEEMAIPFWLCSNAKAVQKLGFKPEYTLALGWKKTIEWYRDNGYL